MGKAASNKPAKRPKLKPVEAKVVKAKLKAEFNDLPIIAVANDVYPNMRPESARVEVQKHLQKPTVQEALEIAMHEAGLSAESLAGVVKDGMTARKVVQVEGDFFETEVPDHSIRLKAAGMAAQWMGVGKNNGESSPSIHFHQHMGTQKDNYGL